MSLKYKIFLKEKLRGDTIWTKKRTKKMAPEKYCIDLSDEMFIELNEVLPSKNVKLQTKGFADYSKRYDVHFKKENESFHISDSDYEWDFGKFFEIAEEIEYR